MRKLSLLALLLGACSWSTFDGLEGQTWVTSVGPPKGANTNKFAANFAAGAVRPTAGGMQLIVLGNDAPDVARLVADGNGIISESDEGGVLTDLQFTKFDDRHPAMASEPGSSVIAFTLVTRGGSMITDPDANTKVAFYDTNGVNGVPQALKQIEPPTGTAGDGLHANKLASGMVFGEVAGDPAQPDVLVARDDEVWFIVDWQLPEGTLPNGNPSTFAQKFCKHQEATSLSIALGDFDSTNAGNEVLLATGPTTGTTGPSKIKIFSPAAVLAYSSGPVGNCFDGSNPVLFEIDKTADGIKDLGKQMQVADFGTTAAPLPAIVATAPLENKVFVFTGEHGQTEIPVDPAPGAVELGDSLAIGDLDGDGVPELVVGDPRATEAGVTGAGAVFVYKFDGSKFGLVDTLYDAQPDAEEHFGTSVTIAPFGTGNQNVLVAGNDGEVFSYFRTTLYPDVRAGHQ